MTSGILADYRPRKENNEEFLMATAGHYSLVSSLAVSWELRELELYMSTLFHNALYTASLKYDSFAPIRI